MKVFIWEYIENLTDSWHSGGGLVIVAEQAPATYESVNEWNGRSHTINLPEPDHTYELAGDVAPQEFVFPDSGCC